MVSWGLSAFCAVFLCGVAKAEPGTQPIQPVMAPHTQETNASEKPEVTKPPVAQSLGVHPPVDQLSAAQPLVVHPPVAPQPDVPLLASQQPVVLAPQGQPEIVKSGDINSPASQTNKIPDVATTASPAGINQVETNVVELLPHRATYSISLDKNYYEEDIENAKGQMTIQLAKAGEGWAIEQKSTLHIYYKDGSAEQVITSLATYESLDGLSIVFMPVPFAGIRKRILVGMPSLRAREGQGLSRMNNLTCRQCNCRWEPFFQRNI